MSTAETEIGVPPSVLDMEIQDRDCEDMGHENGTMVRYGKSVVKSNDI